MKNYVLLLINASNDFVDKNGSMYINGAQESMLRLTEWLGYYKDNIKTVICSQESHTINHISFPRYWKKGPNGTLEPRFGIITLQDYRNGLIEPKNPAKKVWVESYLSDLSLRGEGLNILPYHSLDGTWGQALPKYLTDMFLNKTINPVIIRNEMSDDCEMKSIFEYDYTPFSLLPNMRISESMSLMSKLLRYDKIIIAGVSKDYNIASSIASLISYHKKDLNNKLIFLNDGMVSINQNNPSLKIFEYCEKEFEAINCLMKDIEWE